MYNKERRKVLSAFRLYVIACGGLLLIIVAMLASSVVLSIKNARRQMMYEEVQKVAEPTAVASAVGSKILSGIAASEQAVINDSQHDMDFLRVYWQEGDVVKQAGSDSPQVTITEGWSYSFNLAINVEQRFARNVRAFVRIPLNVEQGKTAKVEILVTADNAAPYYKVIKLTANRDSTQEDEPAPDLWLRYHEDSAVLHSNSFVDGTKLDAEELFTGESGVLLGSNQMDGIIPAGTESLCVVSWTIDAVAKGDNDVIEIKEPQTDTLWDKYQNSLEASKP